jgi:hypothetical protein
VRVYIVCKHKATFLNEIASSYYDSLFNCVTLIMIEMSRKPCDGKVVGTVWQYVHAMSYQLASIVSLTG